MVERELATRFHDAYNARDVEALVVLYDPDVTGIWHVGPVPLRYEGREAVIEHWQREWVAWPDATYEPRRIIIQGEVAATQGLWKATNTGPIVTPDGTEVPAMGAHVDLECATFASYRGDEMTQFENYWDNMLTFIQLGLLPNPVK
jgi:ketosteroid isomerase-like protein